MNESSDLPIHETKNGIIAKHDGYVKLKGLANAPHLNGRIGMVQADMNPKTGRYSIQLDGSYKSPSTGQETSKIIALKKKI